MNISFNKLYKEEVKKGLLGIERKIVFNEGVKEIPDSFIAHAFCDNGDGYERALNEITEIYLPDSVERIGNFAFCELSNLRRIKLSNNLKEIGKRAFKDVGKIKGMLLPRTLEKIGDDFVARSSITKFYVDEDSMETFAFKMAIEPHVELSICPKRIGEYEEAKYDYKSLSKTLGELKVRFNALNQEYNDDKKNKNKDKDFMLNYKKLRLQVDVLSYELDKIHALYREKKLKDGDVWTEYKIDGAYNEEGLLSGRKISRRKLMKNGKENIILTSEVFNAKTKKWSLLQKHQPTKKKNEISTEPKETVKMVDDDGISV